MKTLLVGAFALMSISAFARECVSLTIPLELGKTHAITKAVIKYEKGHYAKKPVVKTVSLEAVCEVDKKGSQMMDLEYSMFADGVELSCDAEVTVDAKGNYDVRSLCEA